MNNRGVAFSSFFCRFQLNRVPQTFGAIIYALADVPAFGADKIDYRAHDEHNVWKKAYRTLSSEFCGGPYKSVACTAKKNCQCHQKKAYCLRSEKSQCGKGQLFAVPLIPRETRNEEW